MPVHNGEYCKTAMIGRAVMDADIVISLTHFKGHEQAGFGGCIKNIGMGCGSRAGKMLQHQSGHPHVIEDACRGCQRCATECGSDAITYLEKEIDGTVYCVTTHFNSQANETILEKIVRLLGIKIEYI